MKTEEISHGEMPEWLNGAVSKTVIPIFGIGGSNPPLSARFTGRVAGATNKELRLTDGREMVSAPGPKDSVSERAAARAGEEGVSEEENPPLSVPICPLPSGERVWVRGFLSLLGRGYG